MNYSFHVLIFIVIFSHVNGGLFDRSSGKKVDDATAKELKSRNAIENCTIEVKTCAPHEGSRVDGTCNNYKYPSRGSARGPYLRILHRNKGNSSTQITKNELPSAREVRTALQSTGRVEDKRTFTTAAVHFLDFITRDITFTDGERDFLQKRKHCCKSEGKSDPRCFPIMVPDDDPYLKVTDIRCLNFSRAESFQDVGCTATVTPELSSKINYQTPVLDLSTIYGVDEQALDTVREYKDGLLELDKRGDRYLPLDLSKTNSVEFKIVNGTEENKTDSKAPKLERNDVCIQNEGNETACYRFGFPEAGNYDLRTTTLEIFFMREHNRLATALHKLNPCWKDDRLFKVARQINIATAANIFLYELLPLFLGYRNMVNFGLLSEAVEHVTAYDEDEVPLVYAEFDVAIKFFHTMLDGRIKRYNGNYHYMGEIPLAESLFKQGLIEDEKIMGEINRGTFYQNAAKIDDIQDPEISENFYGKLQRAHDLAAMDIQRGRDFNIGGYNEYRALCGLVRAKKFEDFLDVIDLEKMLALKTLYKDVNDVDLLAGIMSERFIKGTHVGNTLFFIMGKQIQLLRFADRFWFERENQFHSLSLGQLREIRRTNMARVACDNAEGITYMQPRAFLNIGHGNTQVPCTHIPGPDLSLWEDSSCHNRYDSVKDNELFKYDWMKLQKSIHPISMMGYSSFFDGFMKI